MYPDRKKALELLYEAHRHNEGPWLLHSLTCAHCAEAIAFHADMDPDKAYVLGLLHDIGRRFGKRHLGHVSDGYSYMISLGYDDAARICLSHSFNERDIDAYVGNFDTSEKETKLIRERLEEAVFDDYDLLIQLCDAISGSEVVMDIEERMSDVKRRYGDYDQNKWDKNLHLKSYFEKKMDMDVYEAVDKDHFRPMDIFLKEEPLYVIGHLNPDTDAVSSMLAYRDLLEKTGINAKAAVSGKIGRESQYVLSFMGQEGPEILDEIRGKRVILIDHNDVAQSAFQTDEKDIIGVIDHHEAGKPCENELFVHIIETIGATASLIWRLYQEKGIPIPEKTAGILLGGLLSDTRNMAVNVYDVDREAYRDLKRRSDISDTDGYYRDLRDAYLDHEGMNEAEIFASDYKEYECQGIRYGIAVIATSDEKKKKEMLKRMERYLKDHHEEYSAKMLFLKVKDDDSGKMSMIGYGDHADEILMSLTRNQEDGIYVFDGSYSRKKYRVPMIEDWITEERSRK